MSDYPMLISNKLHSFRNFKYTNIFLLLHNFIPLISNFRQNYSKQHTSSILFRIE